MLVVQRRGVLLKERFLINRDNRSGLNIKGYPDFSGYPSKIHLWGEARYSLAPISPHIEERVLIG